MADRSQRLTRRQQKLSEKGENSKKENYTPSVRSLNLKLNHVSPMTDNQSIMFEQYDANKHLLVLGAPGVGKSYLSMYLALREIEDKYSSVNKLVIIRSAQPSKQIGFLKGDEKQKVAVYELPYRNICSKLYGRADAYDILKQKGIIEFQSTSFLRGNEYENSVILYDEVQNGNYMEIKTAVTRLGNESRLIISGDTKQDDLTSERFNEESGVHTLIRVCKKIPSVSTIVFNVEDIVRHGFVKEFIQAELELGLI